MNKAVRTEHAEAVHFATQVRLHRNRYPALRLLTAVPLGGKRPISVARKMKAEGAVAGYPDYLLDCPRGGFHGLRIELKRTDASPSDTGQEQREWHQLLRDEGYRVEVCKGADAAWATVCDYLGITK